MASALGRANTVVALVISTTSVSFASIVADVALGLAASFVVGAAAFAIAMRISALGIEAHVQQRACPR
jgi:hypothetical protein